ncbi:MAG TPA: hypothetical protein VIX86_17420 [Streptosporangiaceae bacterium]
MSAIFVEHLAKHHGGVTATEDISFDIPPGHVTALPGQLAVSTWLGA